MKIKSVSIQGMHHFKNKTYSFNDINYLHGKNGAGKSTVLNAIQLAILGYIPGTAKQTAAIFQHTSEPEMKIRVNFDDGRYIERSWRRKGRSIESNLTGSFDADGIKLLINDLELPIFNFGELVGLTANKLKDWFINFLPSESMDIDWKKELEDSLNGLTIMDSNLIPSALEILNTDANVLAKLQAFNSTMKSNQSFMKTELQRSESTVQSLIYYDEEDLVGDTDYLNNEIQRMQLEINSITLEKESMIRAAQTVSVNNNIRRQIASIFCPTAEEITELQRKIRSIEADEIAIIESDNIQLEEASMKYLSHVSEIQAAIREKEAIISGRGICPYTKSECASIASQLDQLRNDITTLNVELTSINTDTQRIANEINQNKARIRQLRNEQISLQSELQKASNAEASKSHLEATLKSDPDMSKFKDLEWYDEEIYNLNQRIVKIRANQQYSSLIDKLTKDKFRMENTLEVYRCWIKLSDPNGLQTKVMDAPFKKLAEDMTKYLSIMFSADIKCNFNLEQRANSFSFGILRDNQYIPYDLLSSGEKTMFALAMMICIVNKTSSPLKILIVDDMLDHLDNDRADEVFNALGRITDTQIIVAGVKDSINAASYTVEIR